MPWQRFAHLRLRPGRNQAISVTTSTAVWSFFAPAHPKATHPTMITQFADFYHSRASALVAAQTNYLTVNSQSRQTLCPQYFGRPRSARPGEKRVDVCYWHKADIQVPPSNVCFWE
jgi:hypothetical protein